MRSVGEEKSKKNKSFIEKHLKSQKLNGKGLVPQCWLDFIQACSETSHVLKSGEDWARQKYEEAKKIINGIRKKVLEKELSFEIPKYFPKQLKKKIEDGLKRVKQERDKILEHLAQAFEDFIKAEENEDRFISLVFGEVNSGKTALSNHIAGLDFGKIRKIRGIELEPKRCFVEGEPVERLEEGPTETTRDYQGFRLPGLLWIDCPGVLSTTFANSQLAHRLTARADFIIFVTSSDAPFKDSEMVELKKLISNSGQTKLDTLVLITKADGFDFATDAKTGREVRYLKPKPLEDIKAQENWMKEKLESTGLADFLILQKTIPISIYIARDALGRDWVDGSFRRAPKKDWERAYEQSGVPELLRTLTNLIREHGPRLKKQWPEKRLFALRLMLKNSINSGIKAIDEIEKRIEPLRRKWLETEQKVREQAIALAIPKVEPTLKDCGIKSLSKFDKKRAEGRLRKILRESLESAIEQYAKPVLEEIQQFYEKIEEMCAKEQFPQLDGLKAIYKKVRYKSQLPRAIGRTLGGAGGSLAGATIGAAIGSSLGPIGAIIGGIFGGVLGGEIGDAIGGEKIVKKCVGTNASEVISNTQKDVKVVLEKGTAKFFKDIDNVVFLNSLERLRSSRQTISLWEAEVMKIKV